MKKSLHSFGLLPLLPFTLLNPILTHEINAQSIEKNIEQNTELQNEVIESNTLSKNQNQNENILDTRSEKILSTKRTISKKKLKESRMTQVNEALRSLTGLQVREEEGASMRPNIGIRGLNPTRSTKISLNEDGLPITYAPYGDNATYYHPPLSRFDAIDVITGAEQLKFGPQTIGGTINYHTIDNPTSRLRVEKGNFGYQHIQAALGTNHTEDLSFQLDHQKTDGNRENQKLETLDLLLKQRIKVNENHTITAQASLFKENSQVPYTGLTQAEYDNFGGKYNPFKNDRFTTSRLGLSLLSELQINENSHLKTTIYDQTFDRNWWRASSTTTDNQCGSTFTNNRLAGNRIDIDQCNSRQGRLRNYRTQGIDNRFTYNLATDNTTGELETGLKIHREQQFRQQINGNTPLAESGRLVEKNSRKTDVIAGFMSYKMKVNQWKINPIIRYERMMNERENLLDANNVKIGEKNINAFNSGISIGYTVKPTQELFASIHQGYAPARTEDLITNNGGFTLVQPEKSVNLEFGLKQKLNIGDYQLTIFRQDFSRLTASGAVAGGSTPLAQGKALFQGIEQSFNTQLHPQINMQFGYTYLPTAKQTSAFYRVDNNQIANNSQAGNRQPYASKHIIHLGINLKSMNEQHRLQTDLYYQSKQFSDFANTITPIANGNGQTGEIAGYFLTNLTYNWQMRKGTDFYISGKNIFDKKYIVDRTRGIIAGMGRNLFAGVEYKF